MLGSEFWWQKLLERKARDQIMDSRKRPFMTFDTTTTAHHRFERCVFFLFFCCFLFSLFLRTWCLSDLYWIPEIMFIIHQATRHTFFSSIVLYYSLGNDLFWTLSLSLSLSLSLIFYICNQMGVITSPCVWVPLCVMQGQLRKDPYPYLVINQIMTSLTFYVCNHGYFLSLSLSLSCKANLK